MARIQFDLQCDRENPECSQFAAVQTLPFAEIIARPKWLQIRVMEACALLFRFLQIESAAWNNVINVNLAPQERSPTHRRNKLSL